MPCSSLEDSLLLKAVVFTLWLSEYWGLRQCLKERRKPRAEFWSSTPASLRNKMATTNSSSETLGMKRICPNTLTMCLSIEYLMANRDLKDKQELTRQEGRMTIQDRGSSIMQSPCGGQEPGQQYRLNESHWGWSRGQMWTRYRG